MSEQSQADAVAAVASIQDPLRRSLFDFVARSAEAVGRDDAAAALGIARGTAAFHLDRLVEAGVLVAEFKRRSGRSGPGAGRPAKLYRPATAEILVSIPERHYDLVGDLLASAIEEADRSGEPAREALARVATEYGRRAGAGAESFQAVLESIGYEPRPDPDGGTVLANCPFHRLATSHTALVCQANLGLLRGAAEGANDREHEITLDPGEGRCCVRLRPRAG